MQRPLDMVVKTLGVTSQPARRIVLELDLREMTERFRAWGIIQEELHIAQGD